MPQIFAKKSYHLRCIPPQDTRVPKEQRSHQSEVQKLTTYSKKSGIKQTPQNTATQIQFIPQLGASSAKTSWQRGPNWEPREANRAWPRRGQPSLEKTDLTGRWVYRNDAELGARKYKVYVQLSIVKRFQTGHLTSQCFVLQPLKQRS